MKVSPPASPLLYDVGTEVEVRIDDDDDGEGFRGAWFEATITSHLRKGPPRYEVTFSSLLAADGISPLREPAASTHVRPRPPKSDKLPLEMDKETEGHGVLMYDTGAKVEVLQKTDKYCNSWFPATITKVISSNTFLVQYEFSKADGEVVTESLAPQYIRPALAFRPPDMEFELGLHVGVDVFVDGGWSCGVVSKVLSEFGEYEVKVKREEKGEQKEEEEVVLVECNADMLRPCYEWTGGKWEISSSSKRYSNRKHQLTSGKRSMSPVNFSRSSDDGEFTDRPESSPKKKLREKLVEGESNSRLSTGAGSASKPEMNATLQKLLSDDHPSKSNSLVSEKNCPEESLQLQETIVALVELSQNSPPRKPNILPDQPEINSTNQPPLRKYQEKQSDSRLTENRSKLSDKAANTSEGNDLVPIAELTKVKSATSCATESLQRKGQKRPAGRALQGHKEDPRIDDMKSKKGTLDRSSKKMVGDLSPAKECCQKSTLTEVSKQDEVSQEKFAVAAGGGGGVTVIEGIIPSTQHTTTMHTRTADIITFGRELKKNATEAEEQLVLSPPREAESIEHGSNDLLSGKSSMVHESATVCSSPLESPNPILFSKKSPMWASIEATEVFRRAPQQPHFLAVRQYLPVLREGMALGLMVSFANLVESIEKLQIEDSMALFEEKISSLALLEANGFNVQVLQSRLNELLQIKNGHEEARRTQEMLEEKIMLEEAESARRDALIDVQHAAILELEHKLNQLHERKESLLAQKMGLTAEISRLKKDVSEVQESYKKAEQHFNKTLALPW